MNKQWFACLAVATLAAGCPSVEVDENEGAPRPTVEFDPGNRIIPFPNNLLLDPATGKLNLPEGCNPNGGPETATAKALREQVLNQLDGFGTFKTTINITFTEAVDPASLEGNAFLYKIASRGMPVNPAESEAIPVTPIVNMTARFDASCANPQLVDQVTFVPNVPLDGGSTYVFGVTQGVKTAGGQDFIPSFVWALVRSVEDPVVLDDAGNVVSDRTPLDPSRPEDLATLRGIDLLWNVHEGPLRFLAAKGHAHGTILIATSFNTQTVADPLDASVAGSPAAEAAGTPPLAGVARVNPAANGENFLRAVLPPNSCSADGGPLPCQAVAEVLQAGLLTKNYQIDTPNPFSANNPIPGPWSDPVSPDVVREGLDAIVGTLITTTAVPCGATGCPTVIFGHGLGSSKSTLVAIASQLAGAGFNAVAIDWVAHDSRAVRISDDPARGCSGTPTATTAPQCFAPFLSPNLAATRDNIRQSIVDLHALTAALKACGTENCGALDVDPDRIVYMGISLGGILGSMGTATVPDIEAAVLNVPGVSWVDILENTETLAIRCSLVDGLIDAGILVGDKFNPAGPSGLCVGEEWKTQPGYRQFAVIGRWVLDPADPVNFTRQLAAKTVLIQEVVGDTVVPNVATELEAALLGLPGMAADPATSASPPPSAAITTDPTDSKFVRYATLPPDAATGFPGNTFSHASLLQPTPGAGVAGQLGTVRLQTDAITFLVLNR
jgi:pimeloyl-ACP methyl ester carboxylesterase